MHQLFVDKMDFDLHLQFWAANTKSQYLISILLAHNIKITQLAVLDIWHVFQGFPVEFDH